MRKYHFRPASLFRLTTLTPNGALRSDAVVLGLDMRVQCWVGEIAQFARPANILPTLLVLPRLPNLLLLLVGLAFSLNVILDHIVINHILLLLRLHLPHHLLLKPLANRQELLRLLLSVVNSLVAFHPIDGGIYKGHYLYQSITHREHSDINPKCIFER